jgi:hypothetical protein
LSSTVHSSLHFSQHGGNNKKENAGELIIRLAGSFHINALPFSGEPAARTVR